MSFRNLPSIDRLLGTPQVTEMILQFGRPLTLDTLRSVLEDARNSIRNGEVLPDEGRLLRSASALLEQEVKPTLRGVVNASGVIIHTNLGRSPLSQAAQKAVIEAAAGYSTLEYDLDQGKRGKREQHAEHLIRKLTGAEAALVVNNNASAILLALTGLAKGREVIISRSQLIEIGGGFRVPDVLKESGAILVEVGTTNRTHLKDFEKAHTENTAVILRAHHSNFKIIGFTTEPSLQELVELGERHGTIVVDDLGSGTLLDTAPFGLGHEPTIQESLQAGAPVVTFSGDKLLGGPQAGVMVGRKAVIDILRTHPLARAVRPDKLCLAGLNATLLHYLKDEAFQEIPIWRMISAEVEEISKRAEAWVTELGQGDVIDGQSTVGGGSLPEETIPTRLLSISTSKPDAFAARLRRADIPVIARIENDQVVFDPRSVLPEQDKLVVAAIEFASANP
jgi:L-seryl-tRNA(Ser) seleniumtransferase